MTYADHARRFLETRPPAVEMPAVANEINEENEQRGSLDDPDIAVWWKDSPAASAPIAWSPPPACCGPIACSRLGPCERHAAGRPCRLEGA